MKKSDAIKRLQDCKQDAFEFKKMFWPNVVFYNKQIEVIESVRDNYETIVPAGNQLGKDFVAGFIILWMFMKYWRPEKDQHYIRIVTTSVKDEHLDVLWGEIGKFISSSRFPFSHKQGGPLFVTHHEIRHESEIDLTGGNAGNYIKGQVSAKGEGLQGHHARMTLLVIDEASGVSQESYVMASTWAKKILIIGNPHPCQNFFKDGVKAGDLLA